MLETIFWQEGFIRPRYVRGPTKALMPLNHEPAATNYFAAFLAALAAFFSFLVAAGAFLVSRVPDCFSLTMMGAQPAMVVMHGYGRIPQHPGIDCASVGSFEGPSPMSVLADFTGTLEATGLAALVAAGGISSSRSPLSPAQIQPASVDLRLGAECYRMPGSVLPLPGESVSTLIRGLALERIDLSPGACLSRNQVYVVRLEEIMALPPGVEAYCNGKSSTGRVDLATRVLTDGSPRYDRVPAGYHGDVWVELIPRSFHVVARQGDALTQAILFRQRRILGGSELAARHALAPLLVEPDGSPAPASACFDGRLVMGADLDRDIVGYVAKRTHHPLVLSKFAALPAGAFFEPVLKP